MAQNLLYKHCNQINENMERIKKSAIIFHCEDNFGGYYKYVLVAEIGEEQEVISKAMKLSTEIYDYEIVSCFI